MKTELPNPFMKTENELHVEELAAALEAELHAYLDRVLRDDGDSAAGLLFLQPSFQELLPYRPPSGGVK